MAADSETVADTAPDAPERDVVDEIDRWFVARGVPHFIESETEGSALDTWTRALPLLIGAYLLLCLNALDVRGWTWQENLAAAFVGVGIGVGAWATSNLLRRRPAFARPRDIDAPELIVFLVGPALPALMFAQPGDALESVVIGLLFLLLIYVWSAYGVGPMLKWGAREGLGQLSGLTGLLARALPLLLIFNMFLFINAEVWELAGRLEGTAYGVVIGMFLVLGVGFAISRIPHFIAQLNDFGSWADIESSAQGTPAAGIELPTTGTPHVSLTLRERLNIGLMVLFGQAFQIMLIVLGITGFFVLFGFLAMDEQTTLRWMGVETIEVVAQTDLENRTLILSEPLLRVSIFLGAFSGMYFTVLLTTDATYQSAISDKVGPQVREALAVRTAYRVERGTYRPGDHHEHRDDGVA